MMTNAFYVLLFLLFGVRELAMAVPGGATTVITADDAAVAWVGRTYTPGDGSVLFDWPGVTASFTVAGGSYIKMTIADTTVTGTRSVQKRMDVNVVVTVVVISNYHFW